MPEQETDLIMIERDGVRYKALAQEMANVFPAASAAYADATLGADVALAVSATWYDGPSVTLTAGTWMVHAVGHYRKGTTGASNVAIRILAGVTAIASGEVYHASVTNIEVNPATFGIVTLPDETVVKLQMAASTGNALSLMKAALANNSQGSNATRISAIRVC